MKDKGTDEEVTDEESQMKNGRHVQRSQIKIGWKTVKNHDFKIFDRQLSENAKNTHFTINVLKRNFRTNLLFEILYIFVVMYIKFAIWDIKISKF